MNTMKDDVARGLGYRHYAEKQAASPYCLGLGYFIFYDQPATLRQHGGEGYNFGLVNQQDQPYEPMLAEVKKTNANLEAVHAGKREPFALKDPLLHLDTAAKNSYTPTFLPGTTSPYINIDHSRPAWFGGLAERLNIMDKLNPAPGFYPVGIIACPAGEKTDAALPPLPVERTAGTRPEPLLQAGRLPRREELLAARSPVPDGRPRIHDELRNDPRHPAARRNQVPPLLARLPGTPASHGAVSTAA
jgi:hypothetical protein